MSDNEIDVKFGADTSELDSGVDSAKDKIGEVGDSTEGLLGSLGELAAAFGAAFAVDKIEEFASQMSGLGTQLENMSAKTGLSTGNIEQFQDTVKVLGGDSESAGMALQRLERSISTASSNAAGPAADAFHRLGVSQQELQNGNVNQILQDMASKMSDTADGANKLGAMMTVAGRGGAVLIPMLDQGKAGLDAMTAAAESTGPSLSGLAAQFDQSHQGIEEMELAQEKLGAQIYSVLEPGLDAAANGLKTMYASIAENISEGASWTGILQYISAALDGMVAAVKGVVAAIEALADIGTGTFKALETEAIGFGTALVDIAHGNVSQAWTDIKSAQTTALADMSKGFSDAGKVTVEYTDSLMKMMDAYNGVKGAVGSGVGGGSHGKGQIAAPAAPAKDKGEKSNDDEAYAADRELYQSNYESKKSMDDAAVASGKMSHSQETSDLSDALTQQQTLTDKSFDDQMALYSEASEKYKQALAANDEAAMQEYAKDADAYNKLMDQKQIADNKFADEHMKLMAAQQEADEKVYTSAIDSVDKSMDTMVSGVLTGTQTMGQMFGRMCGDMIISFAEAVVQIIAKNALLIVAQNMGWTSMAGALQKSLGQWTATETAKTAATTSGEAARTSAQASAAATSQATQAEADSGSIMKSAGTAAAGAYASVAQIPYVGWLLAPAAAVGAFAATAAYASFDVGTDYVPQDMMAMVHKGEMITPADQNPVNNRGASPYTGGGQNESGNGGGDTHVHFHVGAMDGGDVQNFFDKHGPKIASTVQKQMRAGNLKPVGAH